MTGDEAPLMSQLSAFLEAHPGWEPIESESEDDEEDDDDGESEDKFDSEFSVLKKLLCQKFNKLYFLLNLTYEIRIVGKEKSTGDSEEEKVKKTIHKAKVEDDEYKTEEQTYYSIAHTVHEVVTEQASIMVNGKLKEYQIKVFYSF